MTGATLKIADQLRSLVIITGMSGSGKHTAFKAFEDLGYFCVDNLPTQLIPRLVQMTDASGGKISKLAIVVDVRLGEPLSDLEEFFSRTKQVTSKATVIFVDASNEVLARRYSETRRVHPLAQKQTLLQGIQEERGRMAGVRGVANLVIDTRNFTVHDLRNFIYDKFRESTSAYGRYGYRRITILLGWEGWRVNHKRVERLWKQEGLKVPSKQPKRRRLWLGDGSCIRLRPAHKDHVWSYDFVHERTHDGRAFRLLTLVDEYTRECLAIDVKRRESSGCLGSVGGVVRSAGRPPVPHNSDLVFDVRFLPNPNFVSELKNQYGYNRPVVDYLYQFADTREFLRRILDMLEYLLPRYQSEGKKYLAISIGCTGGKHRSVMMASELKKLLEVEGRRISLIHRDLHSE